VRKKTPGAPKRNQNARKAPGEALDTFLHVGCMSGEKRAWKGKATAAGKSLGKWVRDRLNG